MTKDEALKLALEALEKLWNIIDDIDTYGDMAKADEKLYRSLVERRQRTRFEETGITTDGYELSGGAITAIKEALAQPEQKPTDIAALVQGMEVSIDVSTGDHDAQRRLFGTVTLVQQNQRSRHGLILLVQDPQPNFKAQRKPWVGLTEEEIQAVAKQARSKDHAVTLTNKFLREKNL